jgi:dTDP-4-amino-4,6-dideoxy-D-galactose acyltransferase
VTANANVCERLDWDSEFFGRPVGRVCGLRLTVERLAAVDAWADRERVDCLYFLCDPTCPESSRLAEAGGFRLTDVRLTLRMTEGPPPAGPHPAVRPAGPADAAGLAAIARAAHTDSRFFYDGHFPEAACRALYVTWLRRSLDGWAAAVLVADAAGPAGYITCHRDDRGGGSIGLLGVAAAAQGQGLGRQLVAAARDWFADRGAAPVTVVTQGRNVAAQRLYQRAGFVTAEVGLWFHRWRITAAGPRPAREGIE